MIGLFYDYYLNTIFKYEGVVLDQYQSLIERLSFILAVMSVLFFLVVLLIGIKYMFNRFGYWGWRG